MLQLIKILDFLLSSLLQIIIIAQVLLNPEKWVDHLLSLAASPAKALKIKGTIMKEAVQRKEN